MRPKPIPLSTTSLVATFPHKFHVLASHVYTITAKPHSFHKDDQTQSLRSLITSMGVGGREKVFQKKHSSLDPSISNAIQKLFKHSCIYYIQIPESKHNLGEGQTKSSFSRGKGPYLLTRIG